MSGLYGTVRSAKIDPLKDAELFYFYRPNRSTTAEDFTQFKALSASNLVASRGDVNGEIEDILPGMFNLRLPLDTFNDTGIYTVYIRPKEYTTNLVDVSVLADYPDIRGVVINKNAVDGVTDLTGYRIEYFDTTVSPAVRTDRAFIITSCNFCKPIWVNVSDSVSVPKRYQYTDSSANLLFCTLTPCSYGDYSPLFVGDMWINNKGVPDSTYTEETSTELLIHYYDWRLFRTDACYKGAWYADDPTGDYDESTDLSSIGDLEEKENFPFVENKDGSRSLTVHPGIAGRKAGIVYRLAMMCTGLSVRDRTRKPVNWSGITALSRIVPKVETLCFNRFGTASL